MAIPYQGIIPPLITPLRERDQLDLDGLGRLVERLVTGGVSGIFVLGTTGEAPSLSYRLRRELIEATCRFADGRVPILVGITDTSLVESIHLAKDAAKLGAAAVVTSAPYYFPAGQTELREYLEQLVPEMPLPLLLYNMPSLTKISFQKDVLQWAMDQEAIVGLKDSSGDLIYFRRTERQVREQRPDWSLLVGPEELLAEAVLSGGHGGVCGGANLIPQLYVELYAAAAAGELEKTRELSDRVIALSDSIYTVGRYGSSTIKGIKCALSILGVCDDFLAAPFHRFLPKERAQIEQHLAELGIVS